MSWIISGILSIIIIILAIKYNKKQVLDKTELEEQKRKVNELTNQANILSNDIQHYQKRIIELNSASDKAIERYQNSVKDRTNELETYFTQYKQRQQQIIDEDIEQRRGELQQSYEHEKEALDLKLKNFSEIVGKNIQLLQENQDECYKSSQELIEQWKGWTEDAKQRYESVLEPIRQYEKEKQERLFYTIQLPEEYHDDISFLLTTVADKVSHPDIISKLVWAEYVKPYLDDTCKRVNITDQSGIYKLTNIDNNKSYIGKSTNLKKRIQDHFKSSVGIKSIADQAVHHEILKTGFWNWAIEPVIYADKDKLNELEKYYINFFNTQEYGYNKNSGGGG